MNSMTEKKKHLQSNNLSGSGPIGTMTYSTITYGEMLPTSRLSAAYEDFPAAPEDSRAAFEVLPTVLKNLPAATEAHPAASEAPF